MVMFIDFVGERFLVVSVVVDVVCEGFAEGFCEGGSRIKELHNCFVAFST